MKTAMLGLLAETPIHPGAGRGLGVVDLPVAREASTDYPVIVGSSLKGALRDKAETAELNVTDCFGSQDNAGNLIVSDGRLLLLPVRSLTTSFRWVTCPHLIERYVRDLRRSCIGIDRLPEVPKVERGSALAAGDEELFLEERLFPVEGALSEATVESIKPLLLHEETKERLSYQIAVLHDSDFAWFARYGLNIQARNVLEDGSKKSKNLWYEETLPPDTVMYALIAARQDKAFGTLDALFHETDPYLQVGGNETVGQGWFGVTVQKDREGGAA